MTDTVFHFQIGHIVALTFTHYVAIHLKVFCYYFIEQFILCSEDINMCDLSIRVLYGNMLVIYGDPTLLQQSCLMVEVFYCQEVVLSFSLETLDCILVVLQEGNNLA